MESEKSILGAILLDSSSYWKVSDEIKPQHFTTALHSRIWSTLAEMMDNKTPVDLVTVADELNGHHSYLGNLLDLVPAATNIKHYATNVLGKYKSKRLDALSIDIERHNGTIDEKLEMIEARIIEIQEDKSSENVNMKEAMKGAFKEIEKRFVNRGQLIGISTTIPALDRETLGFNPGELIIIAGRPGMGKSAYMLQVCKEAGRGLVFSLEMGMNSLMNRMLAAHSGVNLHSLRSGYLEDADFSRLHTAASDLANNGLLFNSKASIDINHLKATARREHMKKPLKFIAVDHIGLLGGGAENRVNQVSMFSREMKAIAMDLDIPVIALSQLNRKLEERTDKTPIMSDLRDSGSIEQDADKIVFVYRPSYYCLECKTAVSNGEKDCGAHEESFHKHASAEWGHRVDFYKYAKLILGKHREGEPIEAKTYFIGATQRFIEIVEHYEAPTGRLAEAHR